MLYKWTSHILVLIYKCLQNTGDRQVRIVYLLLKTEVPGVKYKPLPRKTHFSRRACSRVPMGVVSLGVTIMTTLCALQDLVG